MGSVNDLLAGFGHILTPQTMLFAVIGCALGMVTGILPGLGPSGATGLLLPVAFVLDPTYSIVMLVAIYYGAMYGGTITSVLLNVPGEAASVATCIDGFEMTKRGLAGKALSIAAVGSFVGGILALIGMLFSATLAEKAIELSYLDTFAFALLALSLVILLSGQSMVKGIIAALFGLFIGMIGLDYFTGVARFTGGVQNLTDGLDFIPVIMGLFGLAEILESIGGKAPKDFTKNIGSLRLSLRDIRESSGSMLRGSLIGFGFGLVPGSPAATCAFVSYGVEKRVSKTPERFGKGAIQGVAGPETANNAMAISNYIPLLMLGIPSSATMAILLAAFTINGLSPGPLLFAQNPEIAWGVIASLWVSNVILLVMALPLVRMWVSILKVPTLVLYAGTIGIMTFGAYTINGQVFDIGVMWAFGIIGFLLRRLGVPLAPAALTIVLGPFLENNFRRALSVQQGDYSAFVGSWPADIAYVLLLTVIVWKVVRSVQTYRAKQRVIQEHEDDLVRTGA